MASASEDEAAGDPGPRLTADLLGHEAAEREILETCASGRAAHAWLISGPRGIGKATLAFRFARFALAGGLEGGEGGLFGALAPASLAMDPAHPVFRRVAAGSHGDLRVIERGLAEGTGGRRRGEIVIGDVRDLGGFMRMTPSEGGWRVVIVDGAEDMNRNAANALLKGLEEPPGRALLLLVSHNPARLLPTIRSRCRRLALRPLEPAVLATLIERSLPELAETERPGLIGLAEGSIGRAMDLAAMGGLALCREMIGLLATAPAFDVARLHGFADQAARDDRAFTATAGLFPWWLARMIRRGAVAGSAGTAEEMWTIPGESAASGRLLAAATLDRWVEVWEKVTTLFARAEAVHLDRKQTVLAAFHAVALVAGRS
ncbi:DNA polymerase III subunit delta' [Rhodospirillum rubrum]|uniref:DNA polymerase III, delta prime subunit n=1 Tax=Rhodospirillum rubrum (strain ATCC 11170 / ATH 1.1.1 / DSM 467 / LMG 4362 / NCIMB 8255 / S1) TaxID=269796 RepID=Q2RTP3_RHORT|nr:DNA polymerase III subunit delta' [Rhodospirillum rubrum]ABC22502.1 DNA polymerase III, delta prime subunit [Rhodospirillum rubrum ATCC 11170]AEO48220.1 DNA polymerase III subunit delta' [Rhodospirillum rubrum F11]MBK5954090.1 DNA polymerase III subunit delta' [Rhodospirillum rubrum]QXG82132.1 DNA polymerase III subunit delta' [Rhodospirillum rubrum]HAQ01467.1 DNA polymerase III subunit delta' [Rhodospirillum rubrum]